MPASPRDRGRWAGERFGTVATPITLDLGTAGGSPLCEVLSLR